MAFWIGAFTSTICGYLGMQVGTKANCITAKECANSVTKGFVVAFRGGQFLGFCLVGIALIILVIIIIIYEMLFIGAEKQLWREGTGEEKEHLLILYLELFEMVAGYGLGGSTVALFARVGGGIYTKAADVGSDLAGKVVAGLEEDDPRNPGVIADNVGDNVGDIAGMGADLFGSLAESTCAGLVVSGTSLELMVNNQGAMYFPLLITAAGIIISFFTTFFASHGPTITVDNVETVLKWQLIISTFFMTFALYPLVKYGLPAEFSFFATTKMAPGADPSFAKVIPENYDPAVDGYILPGKIFTCTQFQAYFCVACGLWSGFIIGYVVEVYTSNTYGPTQELAEACRMGVAPNIILGLALGYMSNIIPQICLAVTIYVSFMFAGMYGIALSALGMLSTLPIALTIDGYGPISDNAGGIAEMCHLHPAVRKRTDKLDAAGNTTAAIGKGFAIGSACLVSLALFGAFVTRTGSNEVNILQPLEFAALIIGAMEPYAFTALTMEAVGKAANEMIAEIRIQWTRPEVMAGQEMPDYQRCIAISTRASIHKMIAPGVMVLLLPFVMGTLFGPGGVNGLLAGAIVSGVQLAISFANSGGAWDNAKKYIETGSNYSKIKLGIDEDAEGRFLFVKQSDAHKAAVVGDTVGDPLKDCSGPSINILMKLSAITSLVFGTFFADTAYLQKWVVAQTS